MAIDPGTYNRRTPVKANTLYRKPPVSYADKMRDVNLVRRAPLTAIKKPVPPPKPVASAPAPVRRRSGNSVGVRTSAPAPAPAPVPAPVPVAAPKPKPMKDIDWFNSDSQYKGEAGRALTDLTAQLAQIMQQRDQNYQSLDIARDDWTKNRQKDLTGAGNDFASSGLLQSGLYAQYADKIAGEYSTADKAMDAQQQNLQQQYGDRGTKVDLASAKGDAQLNKLYGLLGSLGINAGNSYQGALGLAKASSAARATAPLIPTTNW